jgi:hypothetical protein
MSAAEIAEMERRAKIERGIERYFAPRQLSRLDLSNRLGVPVSELADYVRKLEGEGKLPAGTWDGLQHVDYSKTRKQHRP